MLIFQSILSAAQPVRLWSYAKYEMLSPNGARLIDTGSFTYSGNRGLAVDSATDLLHFIVFGSHAEDYSQLNVWFPHRYQRFPERVETQYDSLQRWRWDDASASLQPYIYASKVHVGSRLDSILFFSPGVPNAYSYKYLYDTSGRLAEWRSFSFSPSDNTWYRDHGIQIVRNAAGLPLTRARLAYNATGQPTFTHTSTYHYNALGHLDTLLLDENGIPLNRERFKYDALGRLLVHMQESFNLSTGSYSLPNRDSFVYDGSSNRYLSQYRPVSSDPIQTFNYGSAGQLVADSNILSGRGHTYLRNTDGLVTMITENRFTGESFKTYFYYDSLGADGVHGVSALAAKIEIYPNPASNKIYVRYAAKNRETALLQITDLTGRKLLHTTLQPGEIQLDILKLPLGIYLWKVSENGLEKARGKFVKQ